MYEDLIKNSDYDDIVWASDFNWDADRNTHFAKVVSAFIQRLGLIDLWSKFPIPNTHVHTDGRSKSTIDHILISPRLLDLVADCGILERADNLSRHCPIWVKLRLGLLPLKPKEGQTYIPRRPCWSKAEESDRQNFSTCLYSSLSSIPVPDSLFCSNPHCKQENHLMERDNWVLDIMNSIVCTSYDTLPLNEGALVWQMEMQFR